MQYLCAEPLLIPFHTYSVDICLRVLFMKLLTCPCEHILCYIFRKAEHGCPQEILLTGIIHSLDSLHFPQSLQRRHHIIVIALQSLGPLSAHFDREGDTVKQLHRLAVITILLIRISFSIHHQKGNCRYIDQHTRGFRLIEVLILFLIVKLYILFHRFHLLFLYPITPYRTSVCHITHTA